MEQREGRGREWQRRSKLADRFGSRSAPACSVDSATMQCPWLPFVGPAMRRTCSLTIAVMMCFELAAPGAALAQGKGRATTTGGPESDFSVLVGSPSDRTAVISVLSAKDAQARIEYGVSERELNQKTEAVTLAAGVPVPVDISGLNPNTTYVYRVVVRSTGAADWRPQLTGTFRTVRPAGQAFTFTVQGDSHPERAGRMYDADLYIRALTNVAADKPDFHFMMGDDFSIERLIEQGNKSQNAVNAVYASQRSFLGLVGRRTPLMLVNGNHEQAAKYLLDGTANNFAVLAGRARTSFFPLPAPGGIYTGNSTPVEHVGLLRDYYAWEWGDALFVVIDPYWHSDAAVDNEAGARGPARDDQGAPAERPRRRERENGAPQGAGANQQPLVPPALAAIASAPPPPPAVQPQPEPRGGGRGGGRGARDLWQITLGDEQYRWLQTTLTRSNAKFKFVFSHHVSGTGRGGVEVAPYYEWGGQDRRGGGGNGGRTRNAAAADTQPEPQRATTGRGLDRFFQLRPTWEKPIHAFMRDKGVTIFFQGHDHLYARQELDGIIYQSCPNPADPTFTAFNREAYKSGDIFPNSGHLRVTVTGSGEATCKVEYIRAARPGDEPAHGKNGTIVHEYTLKPRPGLTSVPGTTQETER